MCDMIDTIKLEKPNLTGWVIQIRKKVVIEIPTFCCSSDMNDKLNCTNLTLLDKITILLSFGGMKLITLYLEVVTKKNCNLTRILGCLHCMALVARKYTL